MGQPSSKRAPAAAFQPAEAITALHSADFFPALLRQLDAVVPFTGALLTHIHRDRKPEHIFDTVRAERRRAVVDQYLDSAYLLDPIYDAFRQGATNCVMRLRDVAPDHFRRSTYYKHYYGTIDLGDELAILIGMPRDSAVFVSVGRPGNGSHFATRELALIRRDLDVISALVRKHFDRPTQEPAQIDVGSSISAAMDCFGDGVLTAREQEVATLILRGHSSRSIAARTGTSEGTVKIHRKNLYRKLRISSQSELLASFLGSVMP
ncbi:helix-turn-helix transcriptional regulator [Pseudoruegeria sp. HB172150]|uniref:helix-turn-helix transcriptional regulator n=1 Tax=Pseudoruegeria sp. HB172150 TaxID=2721164 RepID=UPI0015573236|nr:helix-turn-helix transcriptional regulator [Pseudoruegeria sp. HB172150]